MTLPTRADEMFCHAIYTASHVVNQAYAPHLKTLGLTYPQYITLTLLWEEDGQSISQLAAQLEMKTSTMTPLIKRLEEMGLVQRGSLAKDKRRVAIHLTRHGDALRGEAPEVTGCMVKGTKMSRAELGQLQRLLRKLREGLSE